MGDFPNAQRLPGKTPSFWRPAEKLPSRKAE